MNTTHPSEVGTGYSAHQLMSTLYQGIEPYIEKPKAITRSAIQGQKATIIQKLSQLKRDLEDLAIEIMKLEDDLNNTERWPARHSSIKHILIGLLISGILAVIVGSVMNPAGFARDGLGTDSWLRPYIFSLPFAAGTVLAKMFASLGKGVFRTILEGIIILAGIGGFGLFMVEFCTHFAIEHQDFGGLGGGLFDEPESISYKRLLMGQLIAETAVTWGFWKALCALVAHEPSKRWQAIRKDLEQLRIVRSTKESELTALHTQMAELESDEADHNALADGIRQLTLLTSLDHSPQETSAR